MKNPHSKFNTTQPALGQVAVEQQGAPSVAAGPQVTVYLDGEAVKCVESTGPAIVKVVPYGKHKLGRDALVFEFGEGGCAKGR